MKTLQQLPSPEGDSISIGIFSGRERRSRGADIVRLPVRPTLSQPQVSWDEAVRDRLNHICALPIGWDGYRGRPTRFDAAEFALRLLRHVCKPHTPAPAIVPLPSGGLQLEWHADNVNIELIVREPLRVEAWVTDPHAHDDGQEILLTTDFAFKVESFRSRSFLVGYDPLPENKYHGGVWEDGFRGSKLTRGTKKALLREASWYVQINNLPITT